METIIGFVAGYLVGSRDGREGLAKLKESWQAIRSSPQVHQLVADSVAIAGGALRRTAAGSVTAAMNGVGEVLANRPPRPQPRQAA